MPNFMGFKFNADDERTSYINRDFIVSVTYSSAFDSTVVRFVGSRDNFVEIAGDQRQKILDGWREW